MSGPIFLLLRLVMAAALYAFLGWALWLLWQDLRRKSISPADPQLMITLLTRGQPEERFYRYQAAQILIGRDLACDLRLEDKTISARHARLSYHHNQWWVEDLQSRNGTFLNQARVKDPLVIASGDQLRFGELNFEILLGENTVK